MRKNWLSAAWAHWFRPAPLLPDRDFQGPTEPYPGHWRRFPEPWPSVATAATDAQPPRPAELEAALAGLPELWRRVVLARSAARGDDSRVAADLGLTVAQVRDILTRARAAVRDHLERARTDDSW